MCDEENQRQVSGAPRRPPDQEARDLYLEHARKAWEAIYASSDQFDRSLLTLSSGAVGLSIAFIKILVPLRQAAGLPWLYWSWGSFALCIIVTVASFPISITAQEKHLEYLEGYYIRRVDEYLEKAKKCRWSKAIKFCSYGGGVLFLLGMGSMLWFAVENVRRFYS